MLLGWAVPQLRLEQAMANGDRILHLVEKSRVSDLLRMQAAALRELNRRGVLRTFNSPAGDLAEYLFCRAFSWDRADNSQKGFDATDGVRRFQIKGRWMHSPNTSRQLSAIRNPEAFDALAAVLFDRDYGVFRAAVIPRIVVGSRLKHSAHTNSWRFILSDNVWDDPSVEDVTRQLRIVFDDT